MFQEILSTPALMNCFFQVHKIKDFNGNTKHLYSSTVIAPMAKITGTIFKI